MRDHMIDHYVDTRGGDINLQGIPGIKDEHDNRLLCESCFKDCHHVYTSWNIHCSYLSWDVPSAVSVVIILTMLTQL